MSEPSAFLDASRTFVMVRSWDDELKLCEECDNIPVLERGVVEWDGESYPAKYKDFLYYRRYIGKGEHADVYFPVLDTDQIFLVCPHEDEQPITMDRIFNIRDVWALIHANKLQAERKP